ncbi:hypothetical protein OKW49_008019 [Paraburkholderia youngii]
MWDYRRKVRLAETEFPALCEGFGLRRFANRREVAGCLGLTPTPYDSGGSQIEQGISKAGNHRARTMLVELAWRWLRLQPGSLLTESFNRRFAGNGKRMRRVAIVALARRLAVALWRYLEHGEIPAGASLKPVAPRSCGSTSFARSRKEHIMMRGQRARSVGGSPHGDRSQRWGAPVTGVCQCALRACCMRCRLFMRCTDRSSFRHWLERSSHLDLGSGLNPPCDTTASHHSQYKGAGTKSDPFT